MRENVYKANVGEIKRSFFLATVLWSLHVTAVSVVSPDVPDDVPDVPDVNLLFKPAFQTTSSASGIERHSVSTFQRQSKRTQREGYP